MCELNKKKILLIAFKYPPYSGVGSKRWAKFSKYLALDGYKIHVVTVNWIKNGEITWIRDVINPNIIIHRIASFSLHNLKYKNFGSDMLGRMLRKTRFIIFIGLRLIYYVDEAQFWGRSIIPFCKKLIEKEEITNVIATGAPFMANYWAATLKKDLPKINLIQDFQDPWNDNPALSFYFKFQKKKSIEKELFALNNCNTLITVTKGLMNLLKKKINNQQVETAVIYNGFDEVNRTAFPKKRRDFDFIYAGNAYLGREEPLDSFLKALEIVFKKIPSIKFHFYGGFPRNIKVKYPNLIKKKVLKIHTPVNPREIKRKIYDSFASVQLNSKFFPYLVSAKIYEYGDLRRPTLSINYGGEIDKLIKNCKLGISVNGDDVDKIVQKILALYKIWQNNPFYEITSRNLDRYNYKYLTKELEKYLK